MTTAYTYILQCANGEYYVGSTTDLDKRLQEHQAGLGAKFTRTHLPVKLVYYEEYPSISQAFGRERQLQGWSRAKKEALIKPLSDPTETNTQSCTSTTQGNSADVGLATVRWFRSMNRAARNGSPEII